MTATREESWEDDDGYTQEMLENQGFICGLTVEEQEAGPFNPYVHMPSAETVYALPAEGAKKKRWIEVFMLADSCADEHVCGPERFPWIPIETGGHNPCLQVANGQKVMYFGTKTVYFVLADFRVLKVMFKVVDVRRVILSIGRFCEKSPERFLGLGASGAPRGC